MKLKQQPSDFIVEEVSSVPISPEREEHTVFLLEKQEVDTFDAVRRIAGKLRISLFEIGYAGLKDKHAVARQYVSIPTKYNVRGLKLESLSLTLVGHAQKKIKIGDLTGNRFIITVRDLKPDELKDVMARAETVPRCGVPNYFDSQRFGSVLDHEFIGKMIIQKNYEQAVKQYLTMYQKSEPKKIKDEKRRILVQWNDLAGIRVFNKAFSLVIKEYLKTHSWLSAYKRIPANLREMYVNAYQSYLWNECVKEVLRQGVEARKLYSVEYSIGALLFYTGLSEEERKKIPLTFLSVSETAVFTEAEQRIVDAVLRKERVAIPDFDIETETGNFFKARPRNVLLMPTDFSVSSPAPDEINSRGNVQRQKLQVSFTLPKGSYATIVTKGLFAH
ncbi:MAG: tRNA pseudouridine(13) synthase TruD [Candidatus Thermoplasmatota archaeon]|nr:tRNA pseudouridine(13) synthase TruD [Candidatus Thermoplasmatota archaeon]